MKSTLLKRFHSRKKLRSSIALRGKRRRWTFESLESRRMLAVDLPAVMEIDTNHNGLLDVSEIGALSQSLDSGAYVFARLESGEHYVRVASDPPERLEANETLITLDFRGSVSGLKWDDLNGNAVRDAGEPGVAGVRIYADLDSDGQFDDGEPSTLTAANGRYQLLLPPGVYAIREVAPPGTMQTFPLGQSQIQASLFAGEGPATEASATSSANPWHNAFEPADVNDDGLVTMHDALDVIQALRSTGSRVLGGEGESGPAPNRPLYVDVNADLRLNAADLLGVVVTLRGEGEAAPLDDAFDVGANTTGTLLQVLQNDLADGQLTIIGLGTQETGIVGTTAQGDHGGTIVVQSGGVRYTPRPDFYGIERFIYEVRDSADNTTAQAEVTVNVIPDRDYMRFSYQAFQTDGVTPAASVEVGQEFILRVFVQDDRFNFTPTDQRGVFSAFLDLAYNEAALDLVANPPAANPHGFTRDLRFSDQYQELVSVGGFLPGLIDEAGATQTDGFSIDTEPLGPGVIPFFDARFRATAVGNASFAGNAPDDPTHQEVFFRPSNLEPLDPQYVDFGQLNLMITPPIGAVPDAFTRNEDLVGPAGSPLTNPILDLLANDTPFVAGLPLRIAGLGPNGASSIVTSQGGAVEIVDNGAAVRYTPPLNFHGDDSFTYIVTDGAQSETAVVTVTLLPTNDDPTAVDDTFVADNQAILTVNAPGVLANDSDVDGDTVTVVGFQAVSDLGAAVTVNANGRFTYNPTGVAILQNLAPGEVRIDTFTYTAADGRGGMATATVRVFVTRNTGGAHVVEVLVGQDTPNVNFGNMRLEGEAEFESAIRLIADDLHAP